MDINSIWIWLAGLAILISVTSIIISGHILKMKQFFETTILSRSERSFTVIVTRVICHLSSFVRYVVGWYGTSRDHHLNHDHDDHGSHQEAYLIFVIFLH